jgi:hypothetical protein
VIKLGELLFKLVPAIYDGESKSFRLSEEIGEEQFYMTIFNSNIECEPEEEIQWFAVMDIEEGTIKIDDVMQLIKAGQEAQKIRIQKNNIIVEGDV